MPWTVTKTVEVKITIFLDFQKKKNAKVKKTCHTQQSDGCVIKKKGASLWFTSNPRKQKPRAGGLQA